jgi:hypothetical protein
MGGASRQVCVTCWVTDRCYYFVTGGSGLRVARWVALGSQADSVGRAPLHLKSPGLWVLHLESVVWAAVSEGIADKGQGSGRLSKWRLAARQREGLGWGMGGSSLCCLGSPGTSVMREKGDMASYDFLTANHHSVPAMSLPCHSTAGGSSLQRRR